MAGTDTKNRILDAAERLFADHGFGHVSLRQIIAAAGVNLASVHYHFGSKEALFQSILARRIGPLNEERLGILDDLLSRAGGKTPSLPRLLEALVGPPLRLSRDRKRGGERFMKLLGRTFTDPNDQLQEMLFAQFQAVAERFIPLLRKSLPRLPSEDFFWRLNFTIGAMAHTMAHTRHLKFMSGDLCDPEDTDGIITRFVAYATAGMKAPVKSPGGRF
jgi:AcrR family transcriptional regulator